ncbi:MAG: helix-turn-helix transcriptional regulator [Clostridiales bacterium]|nr:helix-turn-helix transcriptional regulator [Clostridiales bacterium]
MSDFRNYLNEQLKDEEFRAEYEKLEPEFSIIQAVIDARKSNNMTQKELSERTGIAQSDISKLENGNSNPTISMLQRLAEGMGMTVKLQFVPKQTRG